ncbi:MAG: glutathione peroxidase [Pseudomonadota bacterium]
MNIYEYVFHAVNGARMPLGHWESQPILLVNTASKCGFTPQLAKLQYLYNEYRGANLVIIALPCNDFGDQEPGTEQDIVRYYWDEYRVSFPITAKIHVRGLEAHPLFRALLDNYGEDILPRWNFTKYLFNGEGQLVEHWPSRVEPTDPALTHQVERNLRSWIF